MYIYAAQAVGVVGLILAIVSFQQNTNRDILLFQTLSSVAFTIHFYMLGAYTGAIMNFFGAARNILFYNRQKEWANKKYWLYVFILIYAVAGAATYKDLFSLLPTGAAMLSTVAFWIKNPKYTRIVMLPTSPCWLTYNLINRSIAGVATEVFIMSSVLVAMFRFDYRKKVK